MSQPNEGPEIPFAEDQSLQRFGRNLTPIGTAVGQVASATAAVEAHQNRLRQQLGKIQAQAAAELPASHRLVAEIDDLVARAARATSADEWRQVEAIADTLPAVYRVEHETDEDRAAGGRGGVEREKRADVATAQQDT